MAKQYKVLVSTASTEQKTTVDVSQFAGDNGQPVRIKAKAGSQYQLQEMGNGKNLAPDYVKVRRKGNDLEVIFEKGRTTDLIIEDYYTVTPSNHSGLIGQAENGDIYSYLPNDPNAQGLIPELANGGQAVNVALGGQEIAGFELAGLPLVAGFPMGLAGAGAGVLALAGAGGGGGGGDGGGNNGGGTQPIAPNGGNKLGLKIGADGNNDGYVNAAEKGSATTTSLTATFDNTKVSVGDVVTFTVGEVEKKVPLTQAMINDGKVTSEGWPIPNDGGTINATVKLTNAAGSTPVTTREAVIDTSAFRNLALAITTDGNLGGEGDGDGDISGFELTQDQDDIKVKVTLPEGVKAGDLLLISGTGNAPKSLVIEQKHIDAKEVLVDFEPLFKGLEAAKGSSNFNGYTFTATAQVSDAAGNVSISTSDAARVDTQPSGAPKLEIQQDTNNNGFLSASEFTDAIQVVVRSGIVDPTTVTLTFPDGTTKKLIFNELSTSYTETYNLRDVDKVNGSLLNFQAKADKESDDPVGSDNIIIDRSDLSGLQIAITTDTGVTGGDETITAGELAASNNKITVKVTLPAGAAVGDVLTITGSGNISQTLVLEPKHITAKTVIVGFSPTADGTTFEASATIRDLAGNTGGPVKDSADMDTPAASDVVGDEQTVGVRSVSLDQPLEEPLDLSAHFMQMETSQPTLDYSSLEVVAEAIDPAALSAAFSNIAPDLAVDYVLQTFSGDLTILLQDPGLPQEMLQLKAADLVAQSSSLLAEFTSVLESLSPQLQAEAQVLLDQLMVSAAFTV